MLVSPLIGDSRPAIQQRLHYYQVAGWLSFGLLLFDLALAIYILVVMRKQKAEHPPTLG